MLRFKGKRVLIVDDEPDLREIIRYEFEVEGAAVEEAPNGQTAIRQIEAEPYDLMISDLRMPEQDGFDLLKSLIKVKNRPRVILVTGFTDLSRAAALELGADDLFFKPIDFENLLIRAEELVKK